MPVQAAHAPGRSASRDPRASAAKLRPRPYGRNKGSSILTYHEIICRPPRLPSNRHPNATPGASSLPRRLLLTKRGVRLSFIAANHREPRRIRPESSYPLCHRPRWLRLNALGPHMAPSGGVRRRPWKGSHQRLRGTADSRLALHVHASSKMSDICVPIMHWCLFDYIPIALEREPYGRISGTSPRTANSLSKRLTPGDAMANQPSRGEIAAGLVSDSSPRALFSCNDLRFLGSPLYEACVQ